MRNTAHQYQDDTERGAGADLLPLHDVAGAALLVLEASAPRPRLIIIDPVLPALEIARIHEAALREILPPFLAEAVGTIRRTDRLVEAAAALGRGQEGVALSAARAYARGMGWAWYRNARYDAARREAERRAAGEFTTARRVVRGLQAAEVLVVLARRATPIPIDGDLVAPEDLPLEDLLPWLDTRARGTALGDLSLGWRDVQWPRQPDGTDWEGPAVVGAVRPRLDDAPVLAAIRALASPRQREILDGLEAGESLAAIARCLGLEEGGVRQQLLRLRRKAAHLAPDGPGPSRCGRQAGPPLHLVLDVRRRRGLHRCAAVRQRAGRRDAVLDHRVGPAAAIPPAQVEGRRGVGVPAGLRRRHGDNRAAPAGSTAQLAWPRPDRAGSPP